MIFYRKFVFNCGDSRVAKLLYHQVTARILVMLVFTLVFACGAEAQPSGISRGEQTAWNIINQVVRIRTILPDGSAGEEGFGLVFGERDGALYVVTADHVVRPEEDDGPPGSARGAVSAKVQVIFHSDQGHRYEAELLDLQLPHDDGDLAVIDLPRPKSFKFDPAPVASSDSLVAGTRAWRIGKDARWLPAPNPGQFVDRSGLWLSFDQLDTPKGSSGGPVVTEDGVVGMIVSGNGLSGGSTNVLPIGTMAAVLQHWELPWELRPRPPGPIVPAVTEQERSTPSANTVDRTGAGSEDATSASADAEIALNLTDEDRRHVQHSLNQLGYAASDEDGEFGSQSRNAIRSYQTHSGLPVTGFVDAMVQARLAFDSSHLHAAGAAVLPSPQQTGEGPRDFAKHYYAVTSGPDAMNYLQTVLGDQLNFYGKSLTQAEFLIQQAWYIKRWPEHLFSLRPEPLEASCDSQGKCVVKGIVDYSVRSPERGASSSGSERFVMQLHRSGANSYHVIGLSGVVISRGQAWTPGVADTSPPAPAPIQNDPKWTTRTAGDCGSHFYTWQNSGGIFVFRDQANQTDTERVIAQEGTTTQTETVSSSHQEKSGTRWSYNFEPDGRVRVQNLQTGKGFTLTKCQ